MDPLTVAAGAAAAVGLGIGLRLRRQARQAEAAAAQLARELEAARHAATYDPLTGLLNRRAFARCGAELIGRPSRPALAGVLFDLDGFKQVNDTLGHAAGDEVLAVVAQRFAAYTGDGLAARLGGDEFAGLVTAHPPDHTSRLLAASRLAELLAAPMWVDGRRLTVSASVGLAAAPHGAALTDVLRRADRAMYRAKRSGGGVAVVDAAPERIPPMRSARAPAAVGRDAAALTPDRDPAPAGLARCAPVREPA